jgi:hypothetical protein
MTNKRRVIFPVIVSIFFFCVEGWGKDWKFYVNDGINAFYYDEESITSPIKGFFRVWVRIIRIDDLNKAKQEQHEIILKSMRQKVSEKKEVSKEEIDKLYTDYLQANNEIKKEFLNYLIIPEKRMLEEIRCADRMIHVISGVEYDKEGKAFNDFSNSTTKWDHIIPGTTGEALYQQVCK